MQPNVAGAGNENDETENKQNEAKVYQHLGNTAARNREYEKAKEHYETAHKIFPELKADKNEVTAYLWLGYNQLQVGEYRESIKYYSAVIKFATQLGDKMRKVHGYLGLGCAFANNDDFESSRNYYLEALMTPTDDKSLKRRVHTNLGHVYYKSCRFDAALKSYLKAQELFNDLDESQQEANGVTRMLGHTYRELKQHEKAIECYRKALRIDKEVNGEEIERNRDEKSQESIINEWRGYCCCLVAGKGEEAIVFYEKAKEIAKQDGEKYQEYRTNQAIGNILRNNGKFRKAKIYFLEALENAIELGDKLCEGTSYLDLASISSKEFDYEMVRKWYKKAWYVFETEHIDHDLKEKALNGLRIVRTQKATDSIQIPGKLAKEETSKGRNNAENAHENLNNLYTTDQIATPSRAPDGNNVENLINSTDQKALLSRMPGTPVSWQWIEKSTVHREKLTKLHEYTKHDPDKIQEINGVYVCCSEEFRIGKGSDGTRVYVGLAKDGVEKAVKRLPRDACTKSAQQEKKVLNELNTMKSNYVVKYWFLEEQNDNEYLYLILDLCEETLKSFVKDSDLVALVNFAPVIIQQILKGLVHLHRGPKPILHRDLKPSNILRDVENNWLLADFGISRILARGDETHETERGGTEDWIAVESYFSKGLTDDDKSGKVRCKKESDIQVAGMVAFYILTKGEYAFGEQQDRLRNLLAGKPVGLDKLKDDAAKDLISWMLSHNPKDRPSANEALKHPYLQPPEQQFELLCKVGNQPEIKTKDIKSDVAQKLNSNPKDWRNKIPADVLRYLSTDHLKGKIFSYRPSWTDCLRLIRNVKTHWDEHPRPRPEAFYIVEDPQKYFLNLFPSLCVEVHKIIRSCDWKKRDDLKEYFALQ